MGPIEISVARDFIGHCRHMILIEPNPTLASNAAYMLKCPVLKTAVGFQHGVVSLVDNNGSSYIAGTWAPTPATHGMVHPTDCITFDEVDDGEIDVLALDCEGQEFAVLSKMRSLPELITIEVWEANPYRDQIYAWLKEREYKLRFSTGPTTETQLYSLR